MMIILVMIIILFIFNKDSYDGSGSNGTTIFYPSAPLSLFSLFKVSSVPAWLYCPLQTLDLFQVAYYGLGLICCMIGVAFLVISTHHS
ncbi:MAG TPA: hypothetical protein VNS58_29320 [Puia sp.]|nr:hypothetical protein [Puia sp.]